MDRRWIHVIVLAYIALLPFTAFGIPFPRKVPVFGGSIKYTEIALLALLIVFVVALARRHLRIIRAPILYALLVLQAVAQFLAFPVAEDHDILVRVAIAVTRYSVLVFLLVNVLRSEPLLRAALATMGATGAVIVLGTTAKFLLPGPLPLIEYTALLGRSTPHVLGYALVLFGAGIVFFALEIQRPRWVLWTIFVLAALWMNLVFLAFVKVAQVVLLAFLALLVLTVRVQWRRAALLLTMFVAMFWIRYHLVDLKNDTYAWAITSRTRIAALRVAPRQHSLPPVSSETVAGGLQATLDRLIALATTLPQSIAVAERPIAADALAATTVPPTAGTLTATTGVPTPVPPAPPPVPPAPPPVPPARIASFYTEDNRARLNWVKSRTTDSLSVRKRGIAVGWVIGRTHPLTGIGAGQLAHKEIFDAYAERVRREAHTPSPYPWKSFFFVDEEVPAAVMDKGIFNIFMNAWAETGAPGLLAIVGLLLSVVGWSVVALWRTRRSRVGLSIAILFPLLLALVLYHQTIYLWVHPWFWTTLALTYAAARVALQGARDDALS
ncbi:hypothetical protein HY634_01490 [Candidatus Uhrbacteria bacterium]|nr:hypothetical protein [Candidatus Uhrbacteria bacterium]